MSRSTHTSNVLVEDELRAYPIDEVVDRLGVSRSTVKRMLDACELKTLLPRRKGTPIRITARSLRALFEDAEARR
mgnify:FL=1